MSTTRQRNLLEALEAHGGPMHGLDLVSAGVASRFMVYIDLSMLEDSGYVRSRYDDGQGEIESDLPRRRSYEITSAGRAALLRDDL